MLIPIVEQRPRMRRMTLAPGPADFSCTPTTHCQVEEKEHFRPIWSSDAAGLARRLNFIGSHIGRVPEI